MKHAIKILRETELRVMKLAIPHFISKSNRVEISFFTFIQAFPAESEYLLNMRKRDK